MFQLDNAIQIRKEVIRLGIELLSGTLKTGMTEISFTDRLSALRTDRRPSL
jgi:hypothetical protein